MKYHYKQGVRTPRTKSKLFSAIATLGWVVALVLVWDAIFNQSRIIIKAIGG